MPGVLLSCKKDDPGPEVPYGDPVVIIGAGAAGLYAADILHAKGINVIILEAGNQLGGECVHCEIKQKYWFKPRPTFR
ncbi:MAG: NAD(P)-binding protein [Flammeovirgaceae bacterium]|nr:NAD(P)-binding protein [Flammeovirgaceae bacterium]